MTKKELKRLIEQKKAQTKAIKFETTVEEFTKKLFSMMFDGNFNQRKI